MVSHLADRFLRVRIRWLNVAQLNQLLQCLLRRHGILPQIGWMHSGLPGSRFPRRNPLNLWRRFKSLNERLAIHVFPNGHAEYREDGGDDVEQGTAVDAFIWQNTGTFHAKDPVRAMPGGRVVKGTRAGARPEVVAEKPMIGEKYDGGLRTGQLEQPFEHHV